MGTEKEQVESFQKLLTLDGDLDLLYSLLVESQTFLTKQKASELVKYTVNLDTNLRKSIALQRSCLFQVEENADGDDDQVVNSKNRAIPTRPTALVQQTVLDGPSENEKGESSSTFSKSPLRSRVSSQDVQKFKSSAPQPLVVHMAEKPNKCISAGVAIVKLKQQKDEQRKRKEEQTELRK